MQFPYLYTCVISIIYYQIRNTFIQYHTYINSLYCMRQTLRKNKEKIVLNNFDHIILKYIYLFFTNSNATAS